MDKRLHRIHAIHVRVDKRLETSTAHGKVIALNTLTNGITSRVETDAGNLRMAMLDQMPNASFRTFSVLDKHCVRLQSGNGPGESDNGNSAVSKGSQLRSITA